MWQVWKTAPRDTDWSFPCIKATTDSEQPAEAHV